MRIVVIVVLWGCVRSSTVTCGDGRICPANTVCEDRIGECVTTDQLASCRAGASPNDACDGGFCRDIDGDGTCTDCVCLAPRCGDGYIDGAEQCDGDNLGVLPDCTDHAFYDPRAVGCTTDCTYDTTVCTRTCGDGVLDSDHGESCDGAPPAQTCVGFGYDAGWIECLHGGCSPDFTTCTAFDWTPVERTSAYLQAVASAGGHIFAVGFAADDTAVVLDYDGIRWTTHRSQLAVELTGAWAASATDVWMIGQDPSTGDGHLVHFDGATFTDTKLMYPAQAIWGSSATDVWVFQAFMPMHYDGSAWTTVTVPGLQQAQHAWGSGANDLWVSGYGSTSLVLLRYDGSWHDVTPALPSCSPGAGWSFGTDDVYVACASGVEHWNGVAWTATTMARPLAMWGAAANDLYAATLTTALHFDGTRWARASDAIAPVAIGGTTRDVLAVAPTLPAVFRYGGAAWIHDTSLASSPQVGSVYSPRADELFAVLALPGFSGSIAHLADGATSTTGSAIGVGAAGGDIYAVGASYLGRWTGSAFAAETAPSTVEGQTSPHFNAVAGPDTSRVFAVGDGIVTRDSAGTWSACSVDAQIPARPLASVWCTAGTCIAVGVGGHAYRWSGGMPCAWLDDPTPVQSNLTSVWGASADDVWAVGLNGVVLHWDGAAWTQIAITGLGDAIQSVSGTAANDVFLATFTGAVYHHDGAHWAEVHVPISVARGSLAAGAGAVWLAGATATGGAELERLERTHW